MDLTEILIDTLALLGLPGLLVLVVFLLGALWRRRHPPADQAEADARRTPAWAWVLIVAFGVAFGSFNSYQVPGWPAAWRWLVLAYILLLSAGALLQAFWPHRDAYLTAWRVRRGDIAGAIAALEAKVALEPDPAPMPADRAPAPPSSDPWAAPASASATSPRSKSSRRLLAARCNLLGVLESRRDDWAKALDWYERAERAGAGPRELPANKGSALARLGRHREGIELIRSCLDALPAAGSAARAQATLQLAGALIRAGRLDEARATIDRAEVEIDRLPRLHARVRKPLRAGAQTLRDRLTAAEATPATPPA